MKENDYVAQPVSSPGYFSKQECERIRELSKDISTKDGMTGGRTKTKSIRDSKVKWLLPDDESKWVFDKFQAAIVSANQLFKFELTGEHEGLQIAQYTNGGHYGMHLDIGKQAMSSRKLSVTIQLSDGNSYEGGDLEFMCIEVPPAPRETGSVVIFPSFLPHRVTPVTKGVRWSLVTWVHGPPFR